MNKMFIKTALGTALCATLSLAGTAHAASISLSGSDGTGYLAATIKSWTTPPTTSSYPYYWDPDIVLDGGAVGAYRTIAANPLSASSVYPMENETDNAGNPYVIENKTVTDADFNIFSLGAIDYDDSGLTNTGVEVINVSELTLTLTSDEFDSYNSPHNNPAGPSVGDFAFGYDLTASGFSGTGLTFTDGVLTSIDLQADLDVDARFTNGTTINLPLSPGYSQLASFNISGNQLWYDFDQDEPIQSSPLGAIDARLMITRGGTLDAVAVIPVPAAVWLFGSGLLGLVGVARRRGLSQK